MPDKTTEDMNRDGAEPVYGPAYGTRRKAQPGTGPGQPITGQEFDGPAPPYTAPYPPYPSDVPYQTALPVNLAAGLAYLVAPAAVFLLLQPYRSHPLLRFHCWQAIFYFIAAVAVRQVEQLLASMLPSAVAFTLGSLLILLLFAGWAVAAIKALQGQQWLLPVVGKYARQTASTTSSRG